ncbi:TetR/AcrR family transcriptional regulator [Gordonia sp. DT218]|uniref:TetR/AcrR family transcriptional regulator n=1 Tax=unclassified Gordonia (in: high G+C Gram-positive bacteria) TaxID=2657482 RepID=UPI003CF29BF9
MPSQVPIDVGVDRRVRRSRAALFAAAVRLVSERGSSSVSLTELAEAADLSRQAVYSHFCDRDSVIVAAGIDLIERELFPALNECGDGAWGEMTLLATRHLAQYRAYYRALGTGPCAYPAKQAVLAAVGSLHNQIGGQAVRDFEGDDAVTFVVGGCFDLFTRWLDEGDDRLDPEAMADRLLALAGQLFSGDLADSVRRP